jgi:hypothetical protein
VLRLSPSLWLQRLNSGYRLTVINWQDEKAVYSFDFEEYRLTAPDKVVNDWTGEEIGIQNGRLNIELNSHESIVFIWDKF